MFVFLSDLTVSLYSSNSFGPIKAGFANVNFMIIGKSETGVSLSELGINSPRTDRVEGII